jgi:hypothetical protein
MYLSRLMVVCSPVSALKVLWKTSKHAAAAGMTTTLSPAVEQKHEEVGSKEAADTISPSIYI